jgi:tetratricopeptide (TPR) repeat protein
MTKRYTFNELMALDESREFEVKGLQNAQNPVKAIADKYVEEYVNAFLNTSGGTIHFGIDNDGRVLGVGLDRRQRDDLRTQVDQIVQRFSPSVEPDSYELRFIPVDGGGANADLCVVEISVSRGTALLYWTGSQRVWIRRDGGTFAMSPDMIERRLLAEHSLIKPALFQLPADVPDFTGRRDEVRKIEQRIGATGTAVIVGMAGIGKSALAIHVAHLLKARYPDAHLYVNLKGSTSDPLSVEDVLAAILRAFDPTRKLPNTAEKLAPLYRSELHNKHVLVVLDDATNAEQIQALLLSEPTCAIIITSRHEIVLPAAHSIHLGALELAESEALLVSICPRLRTASLKHTSEIFHASEDGIPVQMAKLCGSLPLALRLAGSALAEQVDLPPSEYIAQLEAAQSRLELIEASFNLSYESLDVETRVLWCILSVPANGFDRAAVSALWQVEDDRTQSTLSLLTSYSLVEYSPDNALYRLHDLARLFANSKLDPSVRTIVERRLAAHYGKVLETADHQYVHGGDSLQHGLKSFEADWTNISLGQGLAEILGQQGDIEMAQLCIAYADFGRRILAVRRSPDEQIRWLEAALDCSRQLHDKMSERRVLDYLGSIYVALGKAKRAVDYHDMCLTVSRETGDRSTECVALCGLGRAYFNIGESSRSLETFEQAIALSRESLDRGAEGRALRGLGTTCVNAGDLNRGINCYNQALAIARELHDRHYEAHILEDMGWAYLSLKKESVALETFDKAINAFRFQEPSVCRAIATRSMARAYLRIGKTPQAISYLTEASEGLSAAGDLLDEQITLREMGRALDSLGQRRQAVETFERSLTIAHRIGDRHSECEVLYELGNLHARVGDFPRAYEFFIQASSMCSGIDDGRLEAHVLEHRGLAGLILGKSQESINYLEQAAALLQNCGPRRCESHANINLASAHLCSGNRPAAIEYARLAMERILGSLSPGTLTTNVDDLVPISSGFLVALLRVTLWLLPFRNRFRTRPSRLSSAFTQAAQTLALRASH